MEKSDILKEVNEIYIDELDNDEIVLTFETSANDIDEWDSLSHVMLIVAIEKHFKVRFNSSEIRGWNNVGEMCDSIFNHIG
ncbi:acyl carrier protein [Aureibaculum luteum]|uniref:acyl carrier protein n=1 Tax=Aureibaculum luteum TaxID=1548456 RepID=UPI000E4D5D0A|nr:acyl carrier protein [Aureibaculum luteum]